MGDGTPRVVPALRDSPEQGERRTGDSEEIAAMPVAAISSEDVVLISTIPTIRTSLLEAEDDSAIDLGLNADAVPGEQVHLRRWRDPDKAEALQGQGGAGDRAARS